MSISSNQHINNDLLVSEQGGTLLIQFNRPQARNALTFAMYEGMADAIRAIPNKPHIRVVVITGVGGKAFAAGTDIGQFKAFTDAQHAIAYEQSISKLLGVVADCPVPTIAAVAGACTGGGFGIAACCDIRLATEDAKFGFPMARTLGNCLSLSTHARIADLIGIARVKDLIITARLMDAQELRWGGFITALFANDETMQNAATTLAQNISNHAPLTMRVTKESLAALSPAIDEKLEEVLFLKAYLSEDFQEGVTAFLEKRKPNWKGA